MTDDEKYVVMGRVSEEYAKTHQHLAILKEEAERLSKIFQDLGIALHQPSWVIFDSEPFPAGIKTYEGFRPDKHHFQSSAIDGVRLKALCNEIRETRLKLDTLAERKTSLGL
jgi:hypothetical protein